MSTYVDVFTGSTIYPSDVNLTKLTLTNDITLFWPLEAQPNVPLASSIIEIDSVTSSGLSIILPDASKASNGQTILFNNLTGSLVLIKNAGGTVILSLLANTQWQIYLESNLTSNGVWKVYQFGAATSVANAAALAGAGLKASGSTLNQTIPVIGFTGSFTLSSNDRATLYNFLGVGSDVVVTLPSASSAQNDWFVQIRNSGSASFTIICSSGCLINGASSLTFNQGDSAFLITDGINYYTIGLGQNPVFAFDYVVIDVSGNTDYVLSGYQLNRIAYSFIGTITADISVIVPNTVQQYWAQNATNINSYTLSIKTEDQPSPLALTRGDTIIAFCNGSEVIATTAAAVTPVVNGGVY
jgi:hypothetical protein